MDDAIYREFEVLAAAVGEHTSGLGSLILDYEYPTAALAAPEERLAELPAATQRALARARAIWPSRATCRRSRAPSTHAFPGAEQRLLPILDPGYPPALRAAPDPPPWLFIRGDRSCLARPGVAIVGSRRASQAGLRIAHHLGSYLARRGYLVCSGLALGIDGAAHEGALETGLTAAVLASGLDRASPARHQPLARRIARAGCLLSELPPGTAPDRWRFPRRNRIISGLCQTTIIVEAALPSGTLHTASSALAQGREVLILPWSVFHAGGRGCLRLLRDGATPITDLEELDEFFPACAPKEGAHEATTPAGSRRWADLDDIGRTILSAIGDGQLDMETLAAATGLSPPALLPHLTTLEIQGCIERFAGTYRRRDGA